MKEYRIREEFRCLLDIGSFPRAFRYDSSWKEIYENLQVLDLWYELVYKPAYKVGDIVVVKNHLQAGVGNGIRQENLVTRLYATNGNFDKKPTGLYHDDNCRFVVKEDGRFFGIYEDHIIRKATEDEIEKFRRRLPKIGCSMGEETQSHIKYGGKAMSKKTLRHMKENGIVEVTVERDGEKFRVKEQDLELIYKIAEK